MTKSFVMATVTALVISFARWTSAADAICFEAESMSVVSEPLMSTDANQGGDKLAKAASGGMFLEIALGKGKPPKVTTGEATIEFDLPADGIYYLWGRVFWVGECSNSFTMQLDETKPFIFGEDSTLNAWHWVKSPPALKQMALTKGRHKLTLRNREDGVRLDQVLLTTDKKFTPSDIEPVTFAPVQTKTAETK